MNNKNKMQLAGLTICLAIGMLTSYCTYKVKKALNNISLDDLWGNSEDFSFSSNPQHHTIDIAEAQQEAKSKVKLRSR